MPKDVYKSFALVGCPNVGKSSLFNRLTSLNQHTGNWAGVSVQKATGIYKGKYERFTVVDLPGIYAFHPNSEDERVAVDYILTGEYSFLIVVCDATNIEPGIKLAIEIRMFTDRMIFCINMADQAHRMGLVFDIKAMENSLRCPVVCCSARNEKSLEGLRCAIENCENIFSGSDFVLHTTDEKRRFIKEFVKKSLFCKREQKRSFIFDRILGGKIFFPIAMTAGLLLIFFVTIVVAGYLSEKLFDVLSVTVEYMQNLPDVFPEPIKQCLFTVYYVIVWVVSVMSPAMAIFFPLFTFLEDSGVLPRMAMHLDYPYALVNSSGKQSICQCMGFGCNVVGVHCAKGIASREEKFNAVITNALTPCNGRLPAMISVIGMFMISPGQGAVNAFRSALYMTGFVLFSCVMTFISSFLLSKTVLRGNGFFSLMEIPRYRMPDIRGIVCRSFFNRTLSVLYRAVLFSMLCGIILYMCGYITVGKGNLYTFLVDFFEPFGVLLGVDGVILVSFLLGISANEIVLPLVVMGYSGNALFTSTDNINSLYALLMQNGWDFSTAVCFILLMLFHFPCLNTVSEIYRQTRSIGYTAIAFFYPTALGILLCLLYQMGAQILNIL